MAIAATAGLLLFQTGVTTSSLAAVVLACVLTTLSVLLFGARRSGRDS